VRTKSYSALAQKNSNAGPCAIDDNTLLRQKVERLLGRLPPWHVVHFPDVPYIFALAI
jgi:hypothetical protein